MYKRSAYSSRTVEVKTSHVKYCCRECNKEYVGQRLTVGYSAGFMKSYCLDCVRKALSGEKCDCIQIGKTIPNTLRFMYRTSWTKGKWDTMRYTGTDKEQEYRSKEKEMPPKFLCVDIEEVAALVNQ